MDFLDFNKCFEDCTGGNVKHKVLNYLEKGRLPIIDQGKSFIGGFTDDLSSKYKGDLPCVIFGDHSKKVKYIDFDFALGADGVKALRAKEVLIPKFGYYYLQTVQFPESGYDRNFKYLKRIKIPVPDLSTQRKIVAVLDKAQSLVTKRKESLKQLDELLRATFLEMFGDPVLNPRGWEVSQLESLISNIIDYRGKTPPKSSEGIPLISSANVKNGVLDFSTKHFISEENYKKWTTRGFPKGNSILFTTEAPVGRVALYPSSGVYQISRRVMAMEIDESVMLSEFLMTVFLSENWYGRLSNYFRGSTVPRILKSDILAQKIIIPPLADQIRFRDIFNFSKETREKYENLISESESLFQSLLQQAFKGTLKFADNEEVLDLQLDQKVKDFTKDGEIDWKELSQSLLKHFSPVNNESENDLDKPVIDWEKYKDKSGTDLLMEIGQSLLDFYKDSNKSIELTNEQPIIDWEKYKDKPLTDVFLEVSKAYLNLGKGDEDSKLPFPFNLSENEKNLLIKKFNTYKDGELTSFEDKQEYNDYKGTLFTLIKTGLIKQVFNEETKEMKLELA